jgi:hypothetical protein
MSNDDLIPSPDELELRRRLRQLPREREPARDLWRGIEARLDATAAPGRPVRRPWILAGFAAAASIALALAVLLRPDAPLPAPPVGIVATPPSVAPGTSRFVRREADALTIEYRIAIGAFADAPLPPALQAAATELDASAQQLRTALREQPDAPYLLDRLRRTYDQRLKLTQRAVLG